MQLGRRDLLLAAASLVATSSGGIARAASDRKLGYAIVGLGYYGLNVILPQFANCQHSRVAALVSGDRAKALATAARYGVPERSIYSYETFDQIRDNPDVDIVYVVLPNSMHAEYTIRAAKAGKHVLCEKPMAVSVAECEAMIAACKAAGRKLMIGYRCHFEPYNLEAMRLARTGAAGKIRYVRLRAWLRAARSVQVAAEEGAGRRRLADGHGRLQPAGGPLHDRRGADRRHRPRVHRPRRSPLHEVEDIIEWTLDFPSGALANCLSMYSANQNHILLMGDQGRIELEPATRYDGNRLWTGKDGREQEVTAPPAGPGKTQFAGQLDHLALSVRSGAEPIVSGEEGLRDIRIVEAIYRSAREGRTITL
jgi:predicted dehydrogenase